METTSFECPECFLNLHVAENGPFCLGCGWNIEHNPKSEFPYLSNLSECPECLSARVAVGVPKDLVAKSTVRTSTESMNIRVHPLSLSYIASRHLSRGDTAHHNECLMCHFVWNSKNALSESIEILEAV